MLGIVKPESEVSYCEDRPVRGFLNSFFQNLMDGQVLEMICQSLSALTSSLADVDFLNQLYYCFEGTQRELLYLYLNERLRWINHFENSSTIFLSGQESSHRSIED